MIKEPKSQFMKDRTFKRWTEKGGSFHCGLEGGCYIDIAGEGRTVLSPPMTKEM